MKTLNAMTCDCFERGLTCFHAKRGKARTAELKAYKAEAHKHPLDHIPPVKTWIDLDDRPRQFAQQYNPHR